MAARPPYGQPTARNPFVTQGPSPYSQPARQYSGDSLGSDVYNQRNGSSVPLNAPQGYYGQPGQYNSHCECPRPVYASDHVIRPLTRVVVVVVFFAGGFSCSCSGERGQRERVRAVRAVC